MVKTRQFSFTRVFIILVFISTIFAHGLFAQDIPCYNVRDVVAGNVPGITIEMRGSYLSNLGFILRIHYSQPDSFDLYIPAGTLFKPPPGGTHLQSTDEVAGGQGGVSLFSQYYRMPGGGRPTILPKKTSLYTEDILIYALCHDVNLPPPDTVNAYTPTIDSLESISRFSKMFTAFENFQTMMYNIDGKIKSYQKLTDQETQYAYFIDWLEDYYQVSQSVILKDGIQKRKVNQQFLPYQRGIRKTNLLSQEFIPEMSRFNAQNVVWAMVPDDQNFSAKTITDDIKYALNIDSIDRLDQYMRQANRFLELLKLDRRLCVQDSLTIPVDHDIYYPPYYIITWNGAGAGFAVRITPPDDVSNENIVYYLKDISYYLQADNAGTFQAAILSSENGVPNRDLIPRKLVTFNALTNGDIVTVDVSGDSLKISEDFYVALFQTAANIPNVILTEAINGRSYGFNLQYWGEEQFSLFFDVKLSKKIIVGVNSTMRNTPSVFKLYQNYPNPFNQQTSIAFELTHTSQVAIDIYNLTGQKVKSLLKQTLAPGQHNVQWDGTNDNNLALTSGVYFIQMVTPDYADLKKTIILR